MTSFSSFLRATAFLLFLIVPMAAFAQSSDVFEVDILNEGLDEAPTDLDRLTPQTAVYSFVSAIDEENFEKAAHLLNLNGFSPQTQMMVGANLAEKLGAILDRKVVISWQALLERPDSLDANAPGDTAMAGQTRRSLLFGVLELDGRSVAIRINRVQPENGEAVWVFSRQTVDNIDPLFKLYGPSEFEKSLPTWLREKGPMGLFWWELVAIPLTILLAGFLARLVWQAFTALKDRANNSRVSSILKGSRLPATLFAIASIILGATSYVFVVSGIVSNILEPLIVVLYVAAGLILLVNVIDAFLEGLIEKDVHELASPEEEDRRAFATSIFAVRRMVVAIAVLAAAGITLTTAKVFQTLGFSLLAGAGGLALMLSFAGREVLANILASIQISANRSARVGDQLIFRNTLCTVERIHFSFVQLKVWDGTRLVVPVSEFVSESFTNRTLVDSDMIRTVTLIVAPAIDIHGVRMAYEKWIANDDRTTDHTECYVVDQNEYGIHLRLAAHVPDPRNGWDVECELREAMVAHLAKSDNDGLPHIGTDAPDSKSVRLAEAADVAAE